MNFLVTPWTFTLQGEFQEISQLPLMMRPTSGSGSPAPLVWFLAQLFYTGHVLRSSVPSLKNPLGDSGKFYAGKMPSYMETPKFWGTLCRILGWGLMWISASVMGILHRKDVILYRICNRSIDRQTFLLKNYFPSFQEIPWDFQQYFSERDKNHWAEKPPFERKTGRKAAKFAFLEQSVHC